LADAGDLAGDAVGVVTEVPDGCGGCLGGHCLPLVLLAVALPPAAVIVIR